MSHILFVSDNEDFAEDLKAQVLRFAPDFSFVETAPDLLLVDENEELCKDLRQKYPSVPLIFLSMESKQNNRLNIYVKKRYIRFNGKI